MENKLFTRIVIFIVAVVALGGLGWVVVRNQHPATAVADSKVPPLPSGNLAPTQDFLNDYREYQALQKELNALFADKGIKRKQDELAGMIARLNRAIPQGYGWDEATMSFKPLPAPTLTPIGSGTTPPAKK